MNAALLSLVLVSGVCGDVPPDEQCDFLTPPSITVSMPAMNNPAHACPSCGNSVVPPLYQTCPQYAQPQLKTTPAWNTDYHPAWYFYHRMFLHPADYTHPYPYWERFAYPWNDPRYPCAVPPIGY